MTLPTGFPPFPRPGMTRRGFLHLGTTAAASAVLAGRNGSLAQTLPPPAPAPQDDAPMAPDPERLEWRNRRPEMAYRRLGRTNLMVSEIVCGGDPIRLGNYEHLELALEMGLNYLDMAPAYGGGECEAAFGKLLAGGSRRDRVFLATKISRFKEVRNRAYLDLFEALPEGKKEAVVRRAEAMMAERGAARPGYFLEYFPGQRRGLAAVYLAEAMARDYRHRVEGAPDFRQTIVESLEGSLRRVGTDCFDILFCPHAADLPEHLAHEEIFETFELLRRQGKVRFLGVSTHNDPAGVLRAAVDDGRYDLVMGAYNAVNGGYLDDALRRAAAADVGFIAMKAAMAVATHHKALQPVPEWRVQMVERIVPGTLKPPLKAYLWALQNPAVTAVISNLWDEQHIRENLALAGKRVELMPA